MANRWVPPKTRSIRTWRPPAGPVPWDQLEDRPSDEAAYEPEVVQLPNVVVLVETPASLLVRIPGHKEEETWIPKRQIWKTSQVQHDGDMGDLHISKGFAIKSGILT